LNDTLPLHRAASPAVVKLIAPRYPQALDEKAWIPGETVLERRLGRLPERTEVARALIREELAMNGGISWFEGIPGQSTSQRVDYFRLFSEVIIREPTLVKQVCIGDKEFEEEEWTELVVGLATATELECLHFDCVSVAGKVGFLKENGLLDGILERNTRLEFLEVCGCGPYLTMKGSVALNRLLRTTLRTLKLDLDLDCSYEMIRGRPDLWIEEKNERRERLAEVQVELDKLDRQLKAVRRSVASETKISDLSTLKLEIRDWRSDFDQYYTAKRLLSREV